MKERKIILFLFCLLSSMTLLASDKICEKYGRKMIACFEKSGYFESEYGIDGDCGDYLFNDIPQSTNSSIVTSVSEKFQTHNFRGRDFKFGVCRLSFQDFMRDKYNLEFGVSISSTLVSVELFSY